MPAEGHPGERDVACFSDGAKPEIRLAMLLDDRLNLGPQGPGPAKPSRWSVKTRTIKHEASSGN